MPKALELAESRRMSIPGSGTSCSGMSSCSAHQALQSAWVESPAATRQHHILILSSLRLHACKLTSEGPGAVLLWFSCVQRPHNGVHHGAANVQASRINPYVHACACVVVARVAPARRGHPSRAACLTTSACMYVSKPKRSPLSER